MKSIKPVLAAMSVFALSFQAHAAGDATAGAIKAQTCVSCHGSATFPGMFPLAQLAGRDADKLVIKTNKFRSGKLFTPMMAMAVIGLKDKDVEDIAAYYQSLGKPFMPLRGILGDEEVQASAY